MGLCCVGQPDGGKYNTIYCMGYVKGMSLRRRPNFKKAKTTQFQKGRDNPILKKGQDNQILKKGQEESQIKGQI